MQATENQEPTLSDVLAEIKAVRNELKGDVEKLGSDVEKLGSDVEKLDYKFQVSQSAGERLERLATSLIAGATISIMAGVILLLLRK